MRIILAFFFFVKFSIPSSPLQEKLAIGKTPQKTPKLNTPKQNKNKTKTSNLKKPQN